MKRTVILFNPRSMRGVGGESPPIALLMAAIYLHEEFRIVIVDQMVEKNWKSRLLGLLEDNPVCIGITALTGRQIRQGLWISRIAKSKGCPVVWGGIHASLLPRQTLRHPLVDYVVDGEGEESFYGLVRALASGGSCKGIAGVWCKENGKPTFGGQRPFVDLNKLPPIPYHLIDTAKYLKQSPHGKSFVLYTSRGCPQRCTFCFNLSFNKCHWRSFSPERVLENIKNILTIHPAVSYLQIWDDNFFVDLKRARKIAEGISRFRPRLTWMALGAHVRDIGRMDEDYLACLKESGLKEIIVGIESGSQKIIDLVKKNFTLEELFFSNRCLGNYGIRPNYSFVSGIPGEDDGDIKKTVEVAFRLKKENPNIVTGNVKPAMCYPGTTLYEEALELGFDPPSRLEKWSEFVWGNYLSLNIPWVSRQRKRFLTWLYYYTLLMNPEYFIIKSKLFIFIASVLRPIAEWRVKKLWFRFPIEAWLMFLIQRFLL